MGLVHKLAALDAKVFTRIRRPGEPAEAYLRRVAARASGISQTEAMAVHAALRQYFAEVDGRPRAD